MREREKDRDGERARQTERDRQTDSQRYIDRVSITELTLPFTLVGPPVKNRPQSS